MLKHFWGKVGEERVVEWKKLEEELGKVAELIERTSNGGEYVMGDTLTYADIALASYIIWIRNTFGRESEEWRDVSSWHGGKWAKVLENLKDYEQV